MIVWRGTVEQSEDKGSSEIVLADQKVLMDWKGVRIYVSLGMAIYTSEFEQRITNI